MRQRRLCAYSPLWRMLTSSGDCSARSTTSSEALSLAQPNAADHFLRHALSFDGIIPNSPLDPMPNPWRTTHGRRQPSQNVTPAFLRHLEAGRQCIKGNHRHCSHPLDHEQQDDLREQANLHHSAHVAITRRLDQDVEQKRRGPPNPANAAGVAESSATRAPTAQTCLDTNPGARRKPHASLLHPHIHSDHLPHAAADAHYLHSVTPPIICIVVTLTLPSIYVSFFPHATYMMSYNLVPRSLRHSLFQTVQYSGTTPFSCFISDTLYLAEDAPII